MNSPPSALVDWAQVIGAAFSLLALVLALWAIVKAKRDLTHERRITHELEVLRDLGELMYEFGQLPHLSDGSIARLRACLLMLPGSDDLPTLRVAVEARPSQQALAGVSATHGNISHMGGFPRFGLIWEEGLAGSELEEAINRRLQ